jgi:hypothetical protein
MWLRSSAYDGGHSRFVSRGQILIGWDVSAAA